MTLLKDRTMFISTVQPIFLTFGIGIYIYIYMTRQSNNYHFLLYHILSYLLKLTRVSSLVGL